MRFRLTAAVGCEHVGARVTVRSRIDGGMLTDTVGRLEDCDETHLFVRDKRGDLHRIDRAGIVASKVIEPAV